MPARTTRPACGSSSPATSFASVVLPEPFGPVSATTSPRRSSSETRVEHRRVVGERDVFDAAHDLADDCEPG